MKAVEDIANDVVQAVAELPDRTSPDDWPDAMLVTGDELRRIVASRLTDEHAFSEGYQEHIADLLDAMRPFTFREGDREDGPSPTAGEWRKLNAAYDAAATAATAPTTA